MKMNYGIILVQFNSYCSHQKNVALLRYEFFKPKQAEGQSFENFVTEFNFLSVKNRWIVWLYLTSLWGWQLKG